MSDGFIKALNAEISEVEGKLAADPLYIRLLKLRDLRRHYAPAADSAAQQGASYKMAAEPGTVSLVGGSVTFRVGRKVSPEREQATRYAREFIEGRMEPTRMDDIYNHIVSKGVQIGGQDPKSNLSAMLSKTDGFVAHGRIGWTYQPEAKTNEAPADAEAPVNPSPTEDQTSAE